MTQHPFGLRHIAWTDQSGDSQGWLVADDVVGIAVRLKKHPDWFVEAHFRVQRRGLLLDGLAILPVDGTAQPRRTREHLLTSVTRSVNNDALHTEAHRWLLVLKQAGKSMAVEAASFRQNRRPGRQGRPNRWYAQVALEYVALCADSKHPLQDLASSLGMSISTARDLVHQARDRGLLSPTRQGQKGGQLTTEAWNLLVGDTSDVPEGHGVLVVLDDLQYEKRGTRAKKQER